MKEGSGHQLRFAFAQGLTIEAMRDALHKTELYQLGDCRLVWVNEGDFWMLWPQEMRSLPHSPLTHQSMLREYGPYITPAPTP